MKKYTEIRMEILATFEELKRIEVEKKVETDRFCKLEFPTLKERKEYMDTHRTEKEESLKHIVTLEDKIETLKMTLRILENNAKQILYAEVTPVIIETMQKYNGKSLGKKTEEKFQNELLEKTGCRVYIDPSKITVYKKSEEWNTECELTMYAKYINGVEVKFLVDNKVQTVTIDKIDLMGKYDYVENIPEEIEFLKQKHHEIYMLKEKLIAECNAFNHRAPDGIPHANYYDIGRIYDKIF